MKRSQVKIFTTGALLGAIFGALVLGPVVHFLLIGAVVAGLVAALSRGRRLVSGRARADKQLKA
jgi:hypothetical protein